MQIEKHSTWPLLALNMEKGQECRWSLQTGKGKGMDSPQEPPEGMQPYRHLDFSPVRPI